MRDTAPVAERLPDDIVERMRRLKEAAAAGTTPFPGVDRAVRRRRRRAVATGDAAWLAALRQTIATRNQADGPDQVHVLWAGEVEGQRYAAAVAPDFDRD